MQVQRAEVKPDVEQCRTEEGKTEVIETWDGDWNSGVWRVAGRKWACRVGSGHVGPSGGKGVRANKH